MKTLLLSAIRSTSSEFHAATGQLLRQHLWHLRDAHVGLTGRQEHVLAVKRLATTFRCRDYRDDFSSCVGNPWDLIT